MTRGGHGPGLLATLLLLACALAGEPGLAAGKGDSGKGGSGASGRSGRHHDGKKHPGRHHPRSRAGAAAGMFWAPGLWPWWDYPSYYLYTEAEPALPVEYIERSEQEARPAGYWLYCAQAQGYFPYVEDCAGGWEQVPATPVK